MRAHGHAQRRGGRRTELISERIEVELSDDERALRVPVAFTWRGQRYVIRQIVSVWVDAGFGAGEVTRTWYRRRHRNAYRVETEGGEVFEVYLDRGGSRRDWVLAKKLE